jgi:hypothetical protein
MIALSSLVIFRSSMISRGPQRLAIARRALALAGLSALLSLPGCHKDTPPAETKTEVKPAPSKPDVRKAQRGTNTDEGVEVPTEEDFEEAVEKQITASSDLQKELDQLEKQIQQP